MIMMLPAAPPVLSSEGPSAHSHKHLLARHHLHSQAENSQPKVKTFAELTWKRASLLPTPENMPYQQLVKSYHTCLLKVGLTAHNRHQKGANGFPRATAWMWLGKPDAAQGLVHIHFSRKIKNQIRRDQ